LIEHIDKAILEAGMEKSKFDSPYFDKNFKGWSGSSYTSRRMFSNLCDLKDANYLEVGVYGASTFVAAVKDNPLKSAYAVDYWVAPLEPGIDGAQVEKNFKDNMKFFLGKQKNIKVLKGDCFSLDLSKIKNKIDIYFYDADHNEESQYKALTYYYPVLNDIFILIVDDWLVPQIRRGTLKAIEDLKLKVNYKVELPLQSETARGKGSTKYGWVEFLDDKPEEKEFLKVRYEHGEIKMLPKSEVEFHYVSLNNYWWNGFGIFLLEKQNVQP
jgi:hypothetical protein